MSQPPSKELALLRRLSRLYDVQTAYFDMQHRRLVASPESLLAVLQALGAPVEGFRDLSAAVEARQHDLWRWRLEPIIVAWEGAAATFELRLPAAEAAGRVALALRLEDGATQAWAIDLESRPVAAEERLRGERYVAKRLALPALPLGYHRLTVEIGAHVLDALVIAAPTVAYQPGSPRSRRWGLFLPLYALHSSRSAGAGDLTDFRSLIDWAAGQGASLIGSLPLLAAFLDEPLDPSPYAPVSRLFWNELYIDSGEPIVTRSKAASKNGLVPYRETMQAKRAVLEAQAGRLSGAEEQDFQRFLAERPAVFDYARFRAAQERRGANWRAWPSPQRDGSLKDGDFDNAVARYHAYAQWRTQQQMETTGAHARARGVELYLDLPVGVHPDGYDAWRYQRLFVEDISVGAPPDVVTTAGQDWGFAPLHPEKLRRAGYEYVIKYLRHQFSVASLLRIDHAMGLHRLYWVPRGAGAHDGVYVRYRPDEMYAILAIESHRHQAGVVGENLGIVPDEMNAALSRHGISRMCVMSIEMTGNAAKPIRSIPRTVVASFATHDLPTFASYWQDLDLRQRVRLGVLDPAQAERERASRAEHRQALLAYLRRAGLLGESDEPEDVLAACLTLLARSRAERVLVNLEDLWLETEPQNVPGTTGDQHPNWQRRARYGIDEFAGLPLLTGALSLLRQLRPKDGAVD